MAADERREREQAAKEQAESEVASRKGRVPDTSAAPKTSGGTPLGLLGTGDAGGTPIAADAPDGPGMMGSVKELFTDNLFKDVKNTVLTLVFGALLAWIAVNAFSFVFLNTKTFDDGTVVRSGWEVVSTQLQVYMVGPDFAGSIPLVNAWIGVWLIAAALGLLLGVNHDPEATPLPLRRQLGLFGAPVIGLGAILAMTDTITPTLCVLATIVIAEAARRGMRLVPDKQRGRVVLLTLPLFLLALAFWADFQLDNTSDWGGLLLTFAVASISIVACFPIGVVMALGRRSSFPLIRPFAVGYIELIRGVPLISLLFLGQFALGFLLPSGMEEPEDIIKAIIMITLFSGAYVAEIVRGGLQSVPSGQVEAGQAVGLQTITITRRIVLPQALRNSIPPLIGQFISLLKDTTLLFIISQREILGAAAGILQLQDFRLQGFAPEAFGFVAFVFWVICFTMSRASQRLETRLGVKTR